MSQQQRALRHVHLHGMLLDGGLLSAWCGGCVHAHWIVQQRIREPLHCRGKGG
jgi:hypothetical protein